MRVTIVAANGQFPCRKGGHGRSAHEKGCAHAGPEPSAGQHHLRARQTHTLLSKDTSASACRPSRRRMPFAMSWAMSRGMPRGDGEGGDEGVRETGRFTSSAKILTSDEYRSMPPATHAIPAFTAFMCLGVSVSHVSQVAQCPG